MPTDSRSRFHSFWCGPLAAIAAGALVLSACTRESSQTRADSAALAPTVDTTARARDTVATTPPPAAPVATSGGLDQSELFVLLRPVPKGEAPAELLVTDSKGRRTGVEPATLKTLREITNASYDSAPPPQQTDTDPEPGALTKQLDVVTPWPGAYSVVVVGRRAGEVMLVVRIVTPRGETRESPARRLAIHSGDVQRFAFTYDPAQTGPIVIASP